MYASLITIDWMLASQLNLKFNIFIFQEEKLSSVCDFLHTGHEMNMKVRETLSTLNASLRKRKLNLNRFGEESNGNEINSTCSFLSELSMTQSDDDLLDVTRPFKKHRPSASMANVSYIDANQRRRSARKTMEWQSNEKRF